MIIIQASNIHESGGKLLLNQLLVELAKTPQKVMLFVDSRFGIKGELAQIESKTVTAVEVRPKILNRLLAEVRLKLVAAKNPEATIFCFGNLPPLLPMKNRVVMYYHTVLYFRKSGRVGRSISLRIKHAIERNWLKWRLGQVTEVLVQSTFVKETFRQEFGFDRIRLFPFSTTSFEFSISERAPQKDIDFVYLAAGTAHKNHELLIKAWELLASENLFPSLHLTIDDRYPHVRDQIRSAVQNSNVKIVSHGLLKHPDAMHLYLRSRATIFPSLCESFGLPLLEAKERNLPIIASELDFVRDLVDPVETFDPTSALSISRAVKRFLNVNNAKVEVAPASKLAEFLNENARLQT